MPRGAIVTLTEERDEARAAVEHLSGVVERQRGEIEALRVRVTRAAAGALGDPSLIEDHLQRQVRDLEAEVARLQRLVHGDGEAQAG